MKVSIVSMFWPRLTDGVAACELDLWQDEDEASREGKREGHKPLEDGVEARVEGECGDVCEGLSVLILDLQFQRSTLCKGGGGSTHVR